eukprot:707654-Prymnesium_polylepis.1
MAHAYGHHTGTTGTAAHQLRCRASENAGAAGALRDCGKSGVTSTHENPRPGMPCDYPETRAQK